MHDQVLNYIIVRDISPYQFLINLSGNKLHFKVTISQHYNISNSLRKNISGRDNDNHRGCEFHSFQKIYTYMFYNNIEIWQHIHPLLNMMIDLKCTTIQYGVQGPGGTLYNGLYGEAPSERAPGKSYLFQPSGQWKGVRNNSPVEVYGRRWKSVMSVGKWTEKD